MHSLQTPSGLMWDESGIRLVIFYHITKKNLELDESFILLYKCMT